MISVLLPTCDSPTKPTLTGAGCRPAIRANTVSAATGREIIPASPVVLPATPSAYAWKRRIPVIALVAALPVAIGAVLLLPAKKPTEQVTVAAPQFATARAFDVLYFVSPVSPACAAPVEAAR